MSSSSVHQAAPQQRVNGTGTNGHANGTGKNGRVKVHVPTTIVKRDGRVVPFDAQRIETALLRCFSSLRSGSGDLLGRPDPAGRQHRGRQISDA